MKKCFLLISIILVAFGFSLNSSVISNSFENNNTNNTEQTSSEQNEIEPNFEATKNEDNENSDPTFDVDPDDIITTPTSAFIDYTYLYAPEPLIAIKWLHIDLSTGEYTEITIGNKKADELTDDITHEWSEDEQYYNYEGTISTNALTLDDGVFYSTTLDVFIDGNSDPNITEEKKVNHFYPVDFVTPKFMDDSKEKGEFLNIEIPDDQGENYGIANYKFNALKVQKGEITKGNIGWLDPEYVNPIKIQWIHDDIVRGTDEIIINENGEYEGTIKSETSFASGRTYTNNHLIVTDDFGYYDDDYLYKSDDFSFKTKGTDHETSIISPEVENGPISISQNEEKIKYNVSSTSNITEISWRIKDDDKNKEDELVGTGAIINKDTNNGKIPLTGELIATELTPGTTYNQTYLEVKTEDEQNGVRSDTYWDFRTSFDGAVSETTKNPKGTTIKLNYVISPPRDSDMEGTFFPLEEIFWKENGKEGNLDSALLPSTPPLGTQTVNGQLIVTDFPKGIWIEDTYLLVAYTGKDAGQDKTKYIRTDVTSFYSGDFKTKKTLIGSSVLGIFVVIFAIVGFFFWAYKKRRRVN